MISRTRLLASLAIGALSLPAQSLELRVVGGSMPGPLELGLSGGLPFEIALIVPSGTAGPTPIGLFDPNDPRSLSIGLDLVGNAIAVITDLFGEASFQGQLTAVPALVDVPLYWQAVTFAFQPTLLDRLSNGDVIRLGLADTFRDRGVATFDQRAFATSLLRADRKALLVGGARGALLAQVATDTTEIWDPITDTFVSGPTMTAPRSMHTQTQLADGRFLLAGGVNGGNDP
ncbi:MAG: hypothetical protein KAI24_16365, partial [Planctomycetes bacterium]|nr:hypothetical protein [Planctomycetota bacterium]